MKAKKPFTNLNSYTNLIESFSNASSPLMSDKETLPEIVFITTYPPRECGIATYSEDLIQSINNQYVNSFSIKVCAIENKNERHEYKNDNVKYILNVSDPESYSTLATTLNEDNNVKIVLIQHEFGLFAESTSHFNSFIEKIKKPLAVVFHTVLPNPDNAFKANVQHILNCADSLIVMTNNAASILQSDYEVDAQKINIIPHGTHLVAHRDKEMLKAKYGYEGQKVLSTFGLLSSGKSIETTLDALPNIIKKTPDVLFLIIGKTHPTVALHEGETYRKFLTEKIKTLKLENNVKFINKYVPLEELLEYLQLTDIYLFTSKDPNQAVSGTFSYAISCGCAIVSTPIPHAKEVLAGDTGLLFDFGNAVQLSEVVNKLLHDEQLRKNMVLNGLHKIMHTAWENSAVAHVKVLEKISGNTLEIHYKNPKVNLDHIKKMTTPFGILQFSKLNHPDIESGYTIDDNARALIAMCQHYKQYKSEEDLKYIAIYLNFIAFCQQEDGRFMNYVDYTHNFTGQNSENLDDSNGRTMWALGYITSLAPILPVEMVKKAESIFQKCLSVTNNIYSTRAMAFIIKGLYYYNRQVKDTDTLIYVKLFADRLVQMYRHESSEDWKWFEGYLTYANSILPEALLCAYSITKDEVYKTIAKQSFDFLIQNTFTESAIKVISNRGWHIKGNEKDIYGEQPIDVAYTILALRKFHDIFKEEDYLNKMEIAFNWFLGNNHLQQIIYNPCTGGCFDGLEQYSVNLNQGAESTISYLMARLTINKYFGNPGITYFRKKNRTHQIAVSKTLNF